MQVCNLKFNLNKTCFAIFLSLIFCCSSLVSKGELYLKKTPLILSYSADRNSALRPSIGQDTDTYDRIGIAQLTVLGTRIREVIEDLIEKRNISRPLHILFTGPSASKKTNLAEVLVKILAENNITSVLVKYDDIAWNSTERTGDIDRKYNNKKVVIIEGTTRIPRDFENIDFYIRLEGSLYKRLDWAMLETGSYELAQIIVGGLAEEHEPKYRDRKPDIILNTDFIDTHFINSGRLYREIKGGFIAVETQSSL